MNLGPLPKVYAEKRPLHDDWPWPLSLIPRRMTGLGLPMPPRQLAGNAPLRMMEVQPGYPLAFEGAWTSVATPDPVPPVGCWTLQAVWLPFFGGFWLPCYIAFSVMLFGRRLHFNGPLKPDVTLGDWFWWFEFSLTWTKVNT